ncbi:MAG: hypothetical protein M1470_09465 [Bacteroidetes bacterium]|nr:hypothetical protein [Bacteroidota bacterium]
MKSLITELIPAFPAHYPDHIRIRDDARRVSSESVNSRRVRQTLRSLATNGLCESLATGGVYDHSIESRQPSTLAFGGSTSKSDDRQILFKKKGTSEASAKLTPSLVREGAKG